jgi:hypothetical protein
LRETSGEAKPDIALDSMEIPIRWASVDSAGNQHKNSADMPKLHATLRANSSMKSTDNSQSLGNVFVETNRPGSISTHVVAPAMAGQAAAASAASESLMNARRFMPPLHRES